MIIKAVPTIRNVKINAKKTAHPMTEDITKSLNKSLFPSFIIQRYIINLKSQNKFKIKKTQPSYGWVLRLKVEIDLIKIAVSTPPISNFNSPKSAYLSLSTPFVVRDTFRCVGIRPCG
jgi:hypothetical protein